MRAVARVLLAAAVPLALVLGLPGCTQAGRQRLAEDVARSVDRSTGTVHQGLLAATLRVVKAPGTTVIPPQASGAFPPVGVALDATAGRAALVVPDRGTIVLYDPETIYARRNTTSPADRRLWARLELDRLPESSVPEFLDMVQSTGPGDIVVVGPLLLTDLLSGVLTGSVRQRRVDDDGNRHITFNASIDKANRKRRLDDDDRDARERLLRSLAIRDDIHSGEVVLRSDGSLAAATFTFAERPDKQSRIDLVVNLALGPARAEPKPDLSSPGRDVSVRVPALGTLKSAVAAQLIPEGTQSFGLLGPPPTPPQGTPAPSEPGE